MKTKLTLGVVLCAAAFAQAHDIRLEWFTMDSGGSTSSRGAYSLSGTMGQPDAGTLSRNGFALEGGFWPAFTGDAITNSVNLRIRRAPSGDVLISWSIQYPDYVLEGANELPAINWFQFPLPPVVNGTEFNMLLPASSPQRCFRLHRP